MSKLTIIIPTYNREIKLLETLKELILQINEYVSIVVLDNNSNVNIEKYCVENNKLVEELVKNKRIIFKRNEVNIGVSANFMRAFELCKTEWLWLVSDDDEISISAIKDIITTIDYLENNKSISYVKFSSSTCKNYEKKFISGIEELIEALSISKDWFNSFIFITNGIYRFPHFKNEIKTGYDNLHTYVPHLMMLINNIYNLDKKYSIYMSDYQVVSYVPPSIGYSYGFVAGLGVGTFKNFTYNLEEKQYLKLESVFAAHNDFKVTIDLYYFCKYNSNSFVAKKLVSNYYDSIKNARGFIYKNLYKNFNLLLNFPIIFEFFIKIITKINPTIKKHIEEIIVRNKNKKNKDY